MSTYIPASLKDAHDAIESARKEYYAAYEKAHPSFVADRSWFADFLKSDVVEAIESGNPRFYAQVAVECMIALNTHTSAARLLGQCVDADLNEEPIVSFGAAGPLRHVSAALHGGVLVLTWTFDDKRNGGEEVVAVLRIPVTPSATQERRFSAPIGADCCGAEFEFFKPAKEEGDNFVVSLDLAALVIAASRPMLAAVRDLSERLDRCEGWKPRERFTLKERLSEFGLDSCEHEVEVVYEAKPYLLGAFGEREPILPIVESVKVSPELAEDDLERFRDALTKGDYESWMQLLHDLGYKEKEYKWGCQYVLKARVGADGSLIGD
jgi:hypothetical protein